MKRRNRQQKLVSEINITPFTDVILVLLVIFMISTPLLHQANIPVKLPDAKNAKNQSSSSIDESYISITSEGIVYLDKKIVTKKELKEKIETVHKKNSQLTVVLRADKRVPFKDVVDVIDILSGLGITKLDIAALTQQNL